MTIIYTVGHSRRSLEEFIHLLKDVGIDTVVDVRRWPVSRKNPQFSRVILEKALTEQGMGYVWMGDELGGYRRFGADVDDDGSARCFDSRGFTAYAQYMLRNPAAQRALRALEELAEKHTMVIMCAEKIPWACHRKLISDWLTSRGHEVIHMIDVGKLVRHKPTKCAVIKGGSLSYK